MKDKQKPKNRYDSISSETLQEFDKEWDYNKNPHPTGADYMVWLIQKGYESEADEAAAEILESLGEDGTENEKAMKKLQDIENKKKNFQEVMKTVMADTGIPTPPNLNLYQQVAGLARQSDKQSQSIEDKIQEVENSLNSIQAALAVRA